MTPKERAAMQQALEAMEGIQHGTDWNNGTHAKIYRPKFPAAITALREALGNSLKPKCFADYQPNHAIDRVCASCPVAAECQTGEQAEQEPVAWVDVTDFDSGEYKFDFMKELNGWHYLYAAPVRTKDLTDDEIEDVCCRLWSGGWRKKAMNDFARAVITKFKEKNK